jgi:hypothetical protein
MCTRIEHRIGTGHALNIDHQMGTYGILMDSFVLTNVHSLKPPRTLILTIGLGTWWDVTDVVDTKEKARRRTTSYMMFKHGRFDNLL